MTDQISAALGLPNITDVLPHSPPAIPVPKITGEEMDPVEEHARECDEIIQEAMTAYRDLMDLAMNMEAIRASSIAEASLKALNLALEASKSKTDRRLKKAQPAKATDAPMVAPKQGVVMTRNELIKKLGAADK